MSSRKSVKSINENVFFYILGCVHTISGRAGRAFAAVEKVFVVEYKGDDPIQGAAQLTVDLYNELEGVEDKSYNCLADRN